MIEPHISAEFLRYSNFDSQITILKGGLQYKTQYNVTCSVKYQGYDETLVVYKLNFTTKSPPTNGTIIVDPPTGTFLETKFNIKLDGWLSENPPVKYKIWGIAEGIKDPFTLTNRWYDASETYISTLP